MKDVCFTCGELFTDLTCSIVVLVHKTCVELLLAGQGLLRALLAPKQRAAEPSKSTLDAFAVMNANFIPGIYDLLIYKLKEVDDGAPAGTQPLTRGFRPCDAMHVAKCTFSKPAQDEQWFMCRKEAEDGEA